MTKTKLILLLLLAFHLSLGFAQKKDKKKKGKSETTQVQVLSEAEEIRAERLFFEGQKEKMIGNLEEAYKAFNEASKINANLDAAFYELAQLQQLADDYVSAQKNMSKALAISPKNVWYLKYNGDLLAAQFKYKEAAEVYRSLRKDNRDTYDYYFQEAYYLIMSDDLKGAIEVYDEIESAVGVQPDASLQKHKIYARLNKPDQAVAELEKLIYAYPDELEFKNDLAEFYMVNGLLSQGVAVYEEILKIDPNNVYALTSLADYYKTQGEDEKALSYSKRAFANPDIPIDAKISVLYNYIKYYDQRKAQIEDAFNLSDILIEAHPKEAKAYAIAGDLRNLDGKTEDALAYYYKSLELRKDVFTVWQQVFFINSDLAKFEELVKQTEEAKEYFPNQAIVYFFNGLGHQQVKAYDDAVKAYQRGLKMTGGNPELEAQFYSNLGDAYNDMKLYEDSDENFEKALELNPRNAYVLNNYSYYLSLRGENLQKAAEMSLLSNEISPNNSSFLDTYAWILYKDGKYKEAKEWQLKAIKAANTSSATLLEHLGDILYKLGDKEEAYVKWEEALKLGGGSDFLIQKVQEKKLYE